MSISKTGSRKIAVNGVDYRWRVSRYRMVSDWKIEQDILSEDYLKVARQYGLGSVADIIFNIPIELFNDPKSKIILKYFGLCVDGFLGPEQITQVKPQLIAQVIEKSLLNGWNPHCKGDHTIKLYENSGEKHRPAVLVLPDIMNEGITNYDNLVTAIRIL